MSSKNEFTRSVLHTRFFVSFVQSCVTFLISETDFLINLRECFWLLTIRSEENYETSFKIVIALICSGHYK